MKPPENPANEPQRLAALHSLGILDTPGDERFDRITRIAKALFNVPIALVSLVDENRQWFKSKQGLEATETPREISFCGHAILGSGVFVVNDTLEDERFADNPLVSANPHIRFYAGCPLQLGRDLTLGTLCIIDTQPREFSRQDAQLLGDLARQVEAELKALQAATIDELTGITNRRGFIELGDRAVDYSRRHSVPLSLVFMDLDCFKKINDDHGHATGDLALQKFSALLTQSCRSSDLPARVGGDEFTLLLANATATEANAVITHVQNRVDAFNQSDAAEFKITASFGSCEFDPQRHNDLSALLAEADKAMYEQKLATKLAAQTPQQP